jgi:hypothetical protein
MAISKVVVVDGNNLIVQIDRGVAGRGITDIQPIEIDNALYLEFFFTDGTTETVGPVGTIQYIGQSPIVVNASTISLSTVPVNLGGTGATTASAARTNLNAADQATTITAGTGLSGGGSLAANRTLSIANTAVTAGSYGSASNTLSATVNAQGQLTALAATPIAVANTQVSGLGTMSTQNANSVAITGGSVTGITDLAVVDGGTGASDASGARTNLGAAASAITINAGTGLSGGGDLSSNRTLSIASTGVTAAAYGSASKTLTATVNAQGQLTVLADTNIAIANTQVSGLGTASTLNAGVALGVATLDAGGTVPLSQIPASIQGGVSYQGSWNASTNTPTLTSSVGTKGYYYVVSVAGSTNLNGITDWLPGDWAIFNGTAWQKIDNTDAVASVNGYTGVVVLTAADVGAPPTARTISAGTGLSGGGDLSANRTISLADTAVTAGAYGSASKTLTATVNAQGQLTALSASDIAIANTQVSGLGTMSTQNANSVSITGGSVTGITDLAIADGGTGQSTAAAAITALTGTQVAGRYLRSDGTNAALSAIQAADVPTLNQNTTGTAAGLSATLAIASGGTGQTTANAAFNALAPSQTGNSGKYLTTDGSNTSWANNPLGTVTSVGVSGGTTGLTTSGGPVTTSGTITLAGTLATTNGGTGLTSFTANGVVYASSTSALATGSALTFDGQTFGLNSPNNGIPIINTGSTGSAANQYIVLNHSPGGGAYVYTSIQLSGTDMFAGGGNLSSYAGSAVINAPGSTGGVIFKTFGTEGFRLTSTSLYTASGINVGIGTSSPTQKLTVAGGIASTTGISALAASTAFFDFNAGSARFAAVSGTTGTAASILFSQYSSNGSVGRDAMTLDSSGNLGLGVTPSAWATYKALQVNTTGVFSNVSGTTRVGDNFYYDGSNYRYLTSSYVSMEQYNGGAGGFAWFTAPTGTAGDAISFTQAMTLDASGRLGIGNTSPDTTLAIGSSAGSGSNGLGIYLARGATTNFLEAYDGTKTFIGGTDSSNGYVKVGSLSNHPVAIVQSNGAAIYIDTSKNVGIGTSSPTQKLEVRTATDKITQFLSGSGTAVQWQTINDAKTANVPLAISTLETYFLTNGTERMRLDSSGNLLVGTSAFANSNTNSAILQASGGTCAFIIQHDTGNVSGNAYEVFNYNGSAIGSITQSGTTAVLYNVTSDQRLKENIQDAAPASALIDALQVREYDWKADGSHQRYGFIAQELVTVVPEAVHQPADPEEMMAVDYSKLVPMLVKEIQSLRKRLADAGIA